MYITCNVGEGMYITCNMRGGFGDLKTCKGLVFRVIGVRGLGTERWFVFRVDMLYLDYYNTTKETDP